jgi:hypothetical protein
VCVEHVWFRAMETGGPSTAIQVSDTAERFLSDVTARSLSEASLKKYRVLPLPWVVGKKTPKPSRTRKAEAH